MRRAPLRAKRTFPCSRISTTYPSRYPPAERGTPFRTDSPPNDEHCRGNLGHSAVRILIGLSLLIPAFSLPRAPTNFTVHLHCRRDAPLPLSPKATISIFGETLEPRYIFGAIKHRPVSCYAIFKGWLLLSQPPGCLRSTTSFNTKSLL